jgi:DNA polymerase-3 subunit beta
MAASFAGNVTIAERANHAVDIVSGRFSSTVFGFSPEDFPRTDVEFPERLEILPGSALADAVLKTAGVVTSFISNPNFAGILFSAEPGRVTLAATDTFRLSIASFPAPGCGGEYRALVSKKGAAELKAMAERSLELEVCCDGKTLSARGDGRVMKTRLLEGRFPDYAALVPVPEREAAVSRDQALSVLKRLSFMASPRNRVMRLSFSEGSLEFSVDNPELGSASDRLDVTFSGPDFGLVIAPEHLAGSLRPMKASSSFRLGFTDAATPVTVSSEDEPGYTAVIATVSQKNAPGGER